MQGSPEYHSILTARVSQTLGQSVASFQSSIREIDVPTSDALWIRPELVVVVRAPRNVTQPAMLVRRAVNLAGRLAYGLVNNPLTAFQSVRAALGGPARATRTGTFARFKMSRVKSPIM